MATTITNLEYKSRIAIGIVFALNGDMSTNDKNRGWTHGVAFALNRPNQAKYGPNGLNPGGVIGLGGTKAILDKDGYNETYALRSSTYPACYAAWNYSAKNKAGTANITMSGLLTARTNYTAPHWYLPSAGQITDIIVNIAGLPRTPDSSHTDVNIRWSPPAATTFLTAINNKWQILKDAGYAAVLLPTDRTWNSSTRILSSGLWSSTPYTDQYLAHDLQAWSDNALWFSNDGGVDSDDSRNVITNILPIISF